MNGELQNPVESGTATLRGTYRFSVVAHHIYLFSAAGHLLFVLLFAALRVPPLALYNIGSTALFLLCIRLNRRERRRTAFVLGALEVFVHSTLAAALIGWPAGYHYFIVGIIPFAMLLPGVRLPVKILIAGAVFAAYGLVYFLTIQAAPPYTLNPAVQLILNYTNLAVAFGAFSLLVHYLHAASLEAEITVQSLSRTDQLTRLLNRRGMEMHLAAACSAIDRTGEPFSILLGDLDHFKRVNDECGHTCGDAVLTAAAHALHSSLRTRDVVCRWGGEEFLVLLPGTESDGAARVAAKLLEAVREIRVPCGAQEIAITITLGGAVARRDFHDNRLVSAADRALYEGKNAGRDRFVMAPGE